MKCNFTLIIPTHNRHKYLERSIMYYKDLDADVFYCDSSETAFLGTLHLNMYYLHLPGKRFVDKILIGLNNIKTEFVALCADDDFILIDSLYLGMKVLEESKVFKTVVGKYIFFKDEFDGNFYSTNRKIPKDLYISPRGNADFFFNDYYQILWAMYDKDILFKSFKIIRKASFSNDNFIELTIGAIACNFGGIKFLNDIWGIRELTDKEHWGKKHRAISNIYFNNKIKNDFRKYKHYLDREVFPTFSKIVLKNYINISFYHYVIKIIKNSLIKLIPTSISRNIRKRQYKTNTYNKINVGKLNINEQRNIKEIKFILDRYVKIN